MTIAYNNFTTESWDQFYDIIKNYVTDPKTGRTSKWIWGAFPDQQYWDGEGDLPLIIINKPNINIENMTVGVSTNDKIRFNGTIVISIICGDGDNAGLDSLSDSIMTAFNTHTSDLITAGLRELRFVNSNAYHLEIPKTDTGFQARNLTYNFFATTGRGST